MKNAKGRKTRKKTTFIGKFVKSFLVVMIVMILAHLGLKSLNTSLNTRKQQCANDIAALKQENELLALEVEKLCDDDRIKAILNDATLSVNSANITDLTN
ncbi:MAG: hypothetical protein IJM15_01950 [Erysipelotrichaceae bacterium]|nr:hypothetical protein [Erysipelotrichaceae bacterium]